MDFPQRRKLFVPHDDAENKTSLMIFQPKNHWRFLCCCYKKKKNNCRHRVFLSLEHALGIRCLVPSASMFYLLCLGPFQMIWPGWHCSAFQARQCQAGQTALITAGMKCAFCFGVFGSVMLQDNVQKRKMSKPNTPSFCMIFGALFLLVSYQKRRKLWRISRCIFLDVLNYDFQQF